MSIVLRSIAGLACLLLATAFSASPATANSKYAAFVVHADSGDVLFDRYSTGRRYPASLTKVMTLYILFEELEAGKLTLDSKLKISRRAAGQPPSKLGLKAGSTIKVEDAIEALVVRSANDVAVVVAEHISGSEWKFAQRMTTRARSLGMRRTTFRNASGLPNSKQVTTARDMATLAARVSQDFPQYFHYFKTTRFSWNGRTYRTHNKVLASFDGATGLKTGYTRRSGFNLATTAERDGQRLIGIVLGGRSGVTRDRHMRDIMNRAYANIKKRPTMIAALHRKKPSPRMKPTLLAKLEAERAVPTVADNEALRDQIRLAAASISAAPDVPSVKQPSNEEPAPAQPTVSSMTSVISSAGVSAASDEQPVDTLGVLIASTAQRSAGHSHGEPSDDFNEYERNRLAALIAETGLVGEGDLESLLEAQWSVQIGAYSSKALAQKELEEAVYAGGLMDRARMVAPAQQEDGATLYRARITSLTENEAVNACDALKQKNISCFVVSDAAALNQ